MSQHRSRPRILFVIDYAASTGGAERLVVGLATHLPQDRFEPWICATRSAEPATARALAESGVRLVTLGRSAKWDIHRLGGLVRILRQHRFDVLHAHKFGSNLWGTLIGSACRVPALVAHEHSWSYEGDAARAWLDGNVIGRLANRSRTPTSRVRRLTTPTFAPNWAWTRLFPSSGSPRCCARRSASTCYSKPTPRCEPRSPAPSS
jgi:hypothetical protein